MAAEDTNKVDDRPSTNGVDTKVPEPNYESIPGEAADAPSLPTRTKPIPEGNESAPNAKSRRKNHRRRHEDDSGDESEGSDREPPPIPNVAHKVEYRHVSSGQIVFYEDSDRFAPTKPPRDQPVLEVITIAFTAQERPHYYSRRESNKPPPIHSMGHTYIQINSAAVVNALRAVVEYYPGQNLIGDSMKVPEPYTIFVHHEQELLKYREEFAPEVMKDDDDPCELGSDTYEHLGIVLDFVSKTMKDSLEKERARHARETPVCTYENLWCLFRPGTDVYYDTQSSGEFDSYIVRHINWEIENGSPVRYNIALWNLCYDAVHIGPRNAGAIILPFDGEKEIAKLDIFPTKYLTEDEHDETPDQMRERLEERGRMFFRLTSKQCMWYDGLTTTFPRQRFVGTVMVDTESFWTWLSADKPPPSGKTGMPPPPPMISDDVGERTIGGIPGCFCKRCMALNNRTSKSKFADYARINPMTTKSLTPHQYWLCDRSVHGFIMKVRAWHRLDVAGFSEPKFDTHLIDDLVLDPATKSLIKSLSKRYAREDADEDSWVVDFTRGKGEGSIFLLHGPPGVGKTYTSECVAQYTRRPLLSLTCTDLGTNPLLIETKLMYWFKLAKHWGTILLIDEADIYMEQRVTRDLDRNNLVAGFLRAMEYYQGILFLTTNRVGVYDEAFLSRIHVSIQYPEFTEEGRQSVWASFFRKLEREGGKVKVGEDAKRYIEGSKEVRAVKWNGREIRNAFQTAVALAEVEASDAVAERKAKEKAEKAKLDKENDTAKEEQPKNQDDKPAVNVSPEQLDEEIDGQKDNAKDNKEDNTDSESNDSDDSEDSEPIILRESHIKAIVRMSSAFKKYLSTLHQGDSTKLAAREGLRVDDFDEVKGREGGEFLHYV